jgi:hypothetical protein
MEERRLPWKVTAAGSWLKKRTLLWLLNLRHRRPIFRVSNLVTLHRMVDPGKITPGTIPVVINNFNRFESLKQETEWVLSLEGGTSVIILDNNSTYGPLLDYYKSLRDHEAVQIVRLGYNSGLEGLEDMQKELSQFPYFVITDPDLIPYKDTPTDILIRMKEVLDRHEAYNHVGASIETDDIPDHYPLKQQVVDWEARYWSPDAPVVAEGVFEAWVDSTFGMYRSTSGVRQIDHALRLDRPYRMKHVDWYMDPDHLTEEQSHYLKLSTRVASWSDKFLKSGGRGEGADAYTGPDWN